MAKEEAIALNLKIFVSATIAFAYIYSHDAILQIYFQILQLLDTCFTFHKFVLSFI